MSQRTLIWWSTGAASAVTAQLTLWRDPTALIVRCETSNEDPDNYRFEADVMNALHRSVTVLKSEKYDSVWDVWEKRRYMCGPDGAACTLQMKVMPRLEFQRPTDIHVFGYTADSRDVARFELLKENYPELILRAPLIDQGVTKAGCMALVERWGIALPRSYTMGFPNANCLGTGCVKATSPNYWALYRREFPQQFARTAALARAIGKRLTRINNERIFIEDIPADWPVTEPIAPACDFLCQLAENEPETIA